MKSKNVNGGRGLENVSNAQYILLALNDLTTPKTRTKDSDVLAQPDQSCRFLTDPESNPQKTRIF